MHFAGSPRENKRPGICNNCRHTFVTLALSEGVDFTTLSSMLDHFSVRFTLNIYGHVTDDMKRDAADKISGVLKGAV